jgi:uncharacterized glyoxalase superfamily protein PhnB
VLLLWFYKGEAMLDAIGIISSDMKKTTSFFSLLGVEFKEIGVGHDHLEATTQSGLRLMLDSETLIKEINPSWTKSPSSGIVLCFKQNSPDDVNKLFAKLTESGFESIKDPWDAFWGQRYASVKDHDGYQVDIFAELSQ